MSIYRDKTNRVYLASLLYDSIDDRNFSAVKSLLCEKGANPNIIVPTKGISSFHLIIGSDDSEFALNVTRLILQCGGDPNVKSDDGLTPVHIAAAWGRIEILRQLLCCGGDPECKDSNWMTPIHYARKENFFECIDLLRSYLPNKYDIINKEIEDCYNFKFEKILIYNGCVAGEYEFDVNLNTNNDFKTENSINFTKESLLELRLPKVDNTNRVLNWFNTHVEDRGSKTYLKHGISTGNTSDEADFVSFESSVDESDNENGKKLNNMLNVTFRKAYKKKRKIRKKIETPRANPQIIITNSSLDSLSSGHDSGISQKSKSVKVDARSEESGIVTLPSSKNSFSLTKLSNMELKIHEASSDYMTSSMTSLLNRNIFAVTNDLSKTLFTSDESCVDNTNVEAESKLDDVESTELSFVTVSEVYRYEDEAEGIILYEKRMVKVGSECSGSIKTGSLSSKMSSLPETLDYDPETLRRELTLLGYQPGPITLSTKRVYLRKLYQLRKHPITLITKEVEPSKSVYSPELERTLKDGHWMSDLATYKKLEEVVVNDFSILDRTKKWREGNTKSSFSYLLLDPRKTQKLPCRAETMEPKDIWETFLSAIFYVGKGKKSRPYSHLYEAVTPWKQSSFSGHNKKIQTILDIWRNGSGVICLHVFQNTIPVEAYTREAAMISALKKDNISNSKAGEFYGTASTWTGKQKRMLGTYLLYKAMTIFLNEGERQLYPEDIQ